MTETELSNRYFNWMYQLVCDERYTQDRTYRKLLNHLHSVNFQYSLPMDGNRAEDGIDLRYRFGYEYGYEDFMIADLLDNRPCSVLEMMVALSIRCEENIMRDFDIGDRTAKWFWSMIASLGLTGMSDASYDAAYTDDVIFRFMNHDFKRNGKGGLFTVSNCKHDLRNVEIWWQMNWYLDSLIQDEEEKYGVHGQ